MIFSIQIPRSLNSDHNITYLPTPEPTPAPREDNNEALSTIFIRSEKPAESGGMDVDKDKGEECLYNDRLLQSTIDEAVLQPLGSKASYI
jgi:hypothetical protein